MLTWHVDRLFRSGPLAALATFVIPAALAVLVTTLSDEENVLGILLVSSGVIVIGSLVGSALASGLGAALFSLGTVVSEVPVVVMAIVGVGLYITLVIHDLAGAFHRAPRITPGIWRNAAFTTAVLVVVSLAAFAIAFMVGTLATWRSIIVPFGIAAVGFGAKLAADSHQTTARQLTAKRRQDTP